MIHSFVKHLGVVLLIFSYAFSTKAQLSTKNKNPFPVKYLSLVDQKIVLKTITLAPVYDNVNGIYSEPIQKLLIDLLQSDKVWGYSEFPDFNSKIFIEKFDSQPSEVIDVLTKTTSQGLLTAYITKGPRGLNAKLKLYTQDQGLILAEESFQDLNSFEISKLREIFVTMYHSLKSRLPYRGYVISRRGLDVTLNLGSMNGVQLGQELVLAQILKINRHPKLKTMVGVEKEIIAKLKIIKVEPYLSFAKIIFEKETGVADIGAKVLPSEYVAYPIPILNLEGVVIGDAPTKIQTITPSADADLMIKSNDGITPEQKDQKEKMLDKHNSFGVLTAQGVITQYKESTALSSGASPSAANNLAPGIYLGIQLYLLKNNFFIDLNTQLNLFSSNNQFAGSTPFQLSYTYNRYTASIGYDYLVADAGPESVDPIKLTAAIGFTNIKTDVSTTTPTSLTSTQTDALDLQLKASMPLSLNYSFIVGAKLDIFLTPKLSESPVNSGSALTSITSFGFFGIYPISDKLHFRSDLGVTNVSATFSGAGTRPVLSTSTSIQSINEQIGIEYLF